MSEEFISQVLLEINGQSITDFKKFTDDSVELNGKVKLMKGKGHFAKNPDYGFSLDYAIPSDTQEFDFTQVRGGTCTIDRENGTRIKFGGVYVLEIGETTYDGDNEAVKTVKFSAKTRK